MKHSTFYYKSPNPPEPTKPTSVGVAAFIEKEGKLLLECRADCHRWSLIGGGLEVNESLVEGLKREVKEETSLDVVDFMLVGTYSDPSRRIAYPDGNVIRLITLVYKVIIKDFSKLKMSDESLALDYFDRSQLLTLDIVETHKHIINDYLNHKSFVLE